MTALSGDIALAQDPPAPAPAPPCTGASRPAAGAVGDSLNQQVWIKDEVPAGWSPPACTGWMAGPTKVLLAAAGRLRITGGSEALAARLTNISSMTGIVYWSTTRNRWRRLFEQAYALSGSDPDARRSDFAAADFVPGAGLYYWLEEDNPTAGVVYEMLVHEFTSDTIVFENVNRTPIEARLLFFSREVAEPGEFRQLYYLEHESDDIWRYYTLVRMGNAKSLVGTSAANYLNRAEAYFRFLGGIRMDREPPAAP